jgi:HTH-type transcriptional regulator/antitoxin HigA
MDSALVPEGFLPDWASPPGETIADILHAREISHGDFGMAMGYSADEVARLISGEDRIDIEVAEKLESIFGAPRTFWMRREHYYRTDLERLERGPR